MRFSKPLLVASASVVLIPLLSASFGAGPSRSETPSEAELLNRIEKLEARVSELEKKAPMSIPFREQAESFLSSGTARMPPGSVAHQFNGSTYYVVPVSVPEASK